MAELEKTKECVLECVQTFDFDYQRLESAVAAASQELERNPYLEQATSCNKPAEQETIDLVAHIREQSAWSEQTFGPSHLRGHEGCIDHLEKELAEIRENPSDLMEWIDAITLAIDGAWRVGHTPEAIASALREKLAINKARQWPDWRTAEPGKAICHTKPAEHEESIERQCLTYPPVPECLGFVTVGGRHYAVFAIKANEDLLVVSCENQTPYLMRKSSPELYDHPHFANSPRLIAAIHAAKGGE